MPWKEEGEVPAWLDVGVAQKLSIDNSIIVGLGGAIVGSRKTVVE